MAEVKIHEHHEQAAQQRQDCIRSLPGGRRAPEPCRKAACENAVRINSNHQVDGKITPVCCDGIIAGAVHPERR
jgi:hypothetical protein